MTAHNATPFDDDFRLMWQCGVCPHDMARHYGCDVSTIAKHARRQGYTRRIKLQQGHPGLTVEQFRAARARASMMGDAARTRIALRERGMVDGLSKKTARASA